MLPRSPRFAALLAAGPLWLFSLLPAAETGRTAGGSEASASLVTPSIGASLTGDRKSLLRRAESEVRRLLQRGDFAGALQQIDEIDLLDPAGAPHASLRLSVHQTAARTLGSSAAAITHLKACLRHLPDDDLAQQARLAEALFVLGQRFSDWEAALHGASLLILLDPARQEDPGFMAGAREALRRAPPRRESRPLQSSLAVNQR